MNVERPPISAALFRFISNGFDFIIAQFVPDKAIFQYGQAGIIGPSNAPLIML
jgi:hypothetical protein